MGWGVAVGPGCSIAYSVALGPSFPIPPPPHPPTDRTSGWTCARSTAAAACSCCQAPTHLPGRSRQLYCRLPARRLSNRQMLVAVAAAVAAAATRGRRATATAAGHPPVTWKSSSWCQWCAARCVRALMLPLSSSCCMTAVWCRPQVVGWVWPSSGWVSCSCPAACAALPRLPVLRYSVAVTAPPTASVPTTRPPPLTEQNRAEFERLSGRAATKKWRWSIRLDTGGGVPGITLEVRGRSLSVQLRGFGAVVSSV